MVKAGVILLVLGIAVVAGGILVARKVVPTSTQQAEEMFGVQSVDVGDDGQARLELKAGQTYSLRLEAEIRGSIDVNQNVEVPVSLTVTDEAGQPLVAIEESVNLNTLGGEHGDVWLATSDDFAAPDSGVGLVAVQVGQMPPGLRLLDLKLQVYSEQAATQAAKGLGLGMLKGGALVCCLGPLLTLVGLIVLIVGLVRGNRQPPE